MSRTTWLQERRMTKFANVLKRWEHCGCTRYVPPGVLPESADLSLLPSFPA